MKTKLWTLAICLWVVTGTLQAQESIDIGYITITNLGDGRMYHQNLANGEALEGEQRIIDGIRSEYKLVNFKGGLYDGSYTYYKHNKLAEEGYYEGGRRNGEFKEYFSDGETVKRSRTYKEGKLNGPDISYYTNGNPEHERNYQNSKEHGVERKWDWESGELVTTLNYVEGKKHGPQVQRISSNTGNHTIYSTYDMGILDGDYREVFEDGVIRREGRYEQGKPVGEWTGNRRYRDDKGKWKTEKMKDPKNNR